MTRELEDRIRRLCGLVYRRHGPETEEGKLASEILEALGRPITDPVRTAEHLRKVKGLE